MKIAAKIAVLVLLLLVVSYFGYEKKEGTFKIVALKYGNEQNLRESLQPLSDFLADKFGMLNGKVEFIEYSQVDSVVHEGDYHIIILTPLAYVRAKQVAQQDQRESHIKLFATHKENERMGYHPVIVTRNDSEIYAIKDLKHKKVGFNVPQSASGFVVPKLILENESVSLNDLTVRIYDGHGALLTAIQTDTTLDAICSYLENGELELLSNHHKIAPPLRLVHLDQTIPFNPYCFGRLFTDKSKQRELIEIICSSNFTDDLAKQIGQMNQASDTIPNWYEESGINITGWFRANETLFDNLEKYTFVKQPKLMDTTSTTLLLYPGKDQAYYFFPYGEDLGLGKSKFMMQVSSDGLVIHGYEELSYYKLSIEEWMTKFEGLDGVSFDNYQQTKVSLVRIE